MLDLSKGTVTYSEVTRLLQNPKTKQWLLNPSFPHDGDCASDHQLVPPQVTKFYDVSGSTLTEGQPGLYCEHCLSVINRVKDAKKKSLEPGFVPDEELNRLIEEAWEEVDG